MRLLLISSSLFGLESKSRRTAAKLVEAWLAVHPQTMVEERDLDADPLPHLTAEAFTARKAGHGPLTVDQCALLTRGDAEIARLEAADVIVIAAPMYNLSVASTLKAWIDHIVVAGRTFRYGERGPEGLLKDKKVFVVSARGSFRDDPLMSSSDFNEPYLRSILGFIGLTDLTFICVAGQGMGPQAAAAGLDMAEREIRQSLAQLFD